jgi:hypothetical protein
MSGADLVVYRFVEIEIRYCGSRGRSGLRKASSCHFVRKEAPRFSDRMDP